jgi:uncharacterized repeat protein (TIGR04138 family)
MVDGRDTTQQLEELASRHGTFREPAYMFVLEALELVSRGFRVRRHVTGEDLLEGIKDLARDRYGVMATDVFHAWGVRSTLDFGRIVFQMVDAGLLTKQEEDSLKDFIDKFDFRQVFEVEYFQGEN